MGRHKKETVAAEVETKEVAIQTTLESLVDYGHAQGQRKYMRDENTGLLLGKDYTFDENGFVDWRAMIDKKFFVLNSWNYAGKFGINTDVLTDEEKEEHLSTAKDEDMLILLGGFKSVARLRGYSQVNSELVHSDAEKSVVKVTIKWMPNFETNFWPLTVSAIKSSSTINTDKGFFRYAEAIAENRAFITCVRNTLNIPVIGSDELKQDEDLNVKYAAPKPNKFLKDFCDKNKISFGEVAARAVENKYTWNESWEDFHKIDAATAGSLLHDLTKIAKSAED